jgi:hypothetical protein
LAEIERQRQLELERQRQAAAAAAERQRQAAAEAERQRQAASFIFTCDAIMRRYGVCAGKTNGSAPSNAMDWWYGNCGHVPYGYGGC